MQANQEIFLLVAREMSISKAAEKAFVSQQCVSDHIKRMEQHYGVKLFTRKPRFQLTEAGVSMLHSLQKIQAVESGIQSRMEEYACGRKGSFTVGISASRAQVLLPWVMPEYCVRFPEVEIRFFLNDTVVLEEQLKKGEIDLFLGVNAVYREGWIYRRLCEDELCFMISDGLLRRHFGSRGSRLLETEADLADFTEVPFIKSYSTSVVNAILQDHLDEYHICLRTPYQISDTDTQISLCSKGVGAAIGPRMLLSRIPAHNLRCPQEEYLHVLPVKHLKTTLRIDLVSSGFMEKPIYIRTFEHLAEQAVKDHIPTLD